MIQNDPSDAFDDSKFAIKVIQILMPPTVMCLSLPFDVSFPITLCFAGGLPLQLELTTFFKASFYFICQYYFPVWTRKRWVGGEGINLD